VWRPLLIDIVRRINVLNDLLANNYYCFNFFIFFAFRIHFANKLVQAERETDRSIGVGHNITQHVSKESIE